MDPTKPSRMSVAPEKSVRPSNYPMIVLPEPPVVKPPPPPKIRLTKAQKKEIKKQKQIDDKIQHVRNHLERELIYSKKSVERGREEWQEICDKITIKELSQELDQWDQQTQRILDRKDYRIKLLLDNLTTAQEQHERNFSKHCTLLDYLIRFCDHMVNSIKALYESNSYDMITEFRTECENRKINDERTNSYCENLIHAQNCVTDETFRLFQISETTRYEDVINSNILKRYQLKTKTIRKMQALRNQLELVFRTLESNNLNARPKNEYDSLMERQQFHEKDFIKQGRIADSGFQTIWDLQNKLTKLETTSNFNIADTQNERNYFVEVYWHLKNKVKLNNEKTVVELQELGSASYKVIEAFKKLEKFGELLLSLTTCCRKFQTQREKVLPFPEMHNIAELQRKTMVDISEEDAQISKKDEKLDTQMKLLNNFNNRSAQAQRHVILLKEELKKLKKENAFYVNAIRTCYEISTHEKIMRSVKASEYMSVLHDEGVLK